MAEGVRDRMVRSAIVQLATHGMQGASFASVLAHSQAPRGSVYHHFPNGKQELVGAALDYVESSMLTVAFADAEGMSVIEVIDRFVDLWRQVLTRSEFRTGCSIMAVTVTADSPELVARAADVFRAWKSRLVELFTSAGLTAEDAGALSTMMIAASEGAVVLARAERSLLPLVTVHEQLVRLAETFG